MYGLLLSFQTFQLLPLLDSTDRAENSKPEMHLFAIHQSLLDCQNDSEEDQRASLIIHIWNNLYN